MPVCSPGSRQQFGAASDADLLTRAPLIHVTSVSADWEHWFQVAGTEIPESIHGGPRVDTMQMGFDAAMRGLGVV